MQDKNEDIKEMKDYLSDLVLPEDTNRRLKIEQHAAEYLLEDDVLYHQWSPRVLGNMKTTRKQLFVPCEEMGKLLHHCHDEMGHAGFLRTFSRIRVFFLDIDEKECRETC